MTRHRASSTGPAPVSRKSPKGQSPPAVSRTRTFFAAFFLSGVAGVMHEVVWSRQLVRLIGVESYAQAAVLTVFMGGLAAGAFAIGRIADRRPPARLYVLLEVLIAAYALL